MDILDKVARLITGGEKNALPMGTGTLSVRDTGSSWIEDNKVKECYGCSTEFNTFVRRHYCRVCARLFCGGCTANRLKPPRDSSDQTELRACNYCYRVRHQSPVRHRTTKAVPSTRSRDHDQGASAKPGTIKSIAGDLTWDVPPELESDWGVPATAANEAEGEEQKTEEAVAAAQKATSTALPKNVIDVYRGLLRDASMNHLRRLMCQLMESEAVSQPDIWLPVLLELAEGAVSYINPSGAGVSDPRQYIKIKKLPCVGRPEDSCVVHGVVCKKNIAHKRMRSQVSNPTVLLLAGSLEIQKTSSKLSSFETLLEQEQEQLREAVTRVAAMRPNVLLVERSVARLGQELLRECGISLVLNVKPELLERLARSMGTKVLQSLDQIGNHTAGFCKEFRVETVSLPVPSPTTTAMANCSSVLSLASAVPSQPPSMASAAPVAGGAEGGVAPGAGVGGASARPTQNTPLMYFDGCPKPLGATILLKGAELDELIKIKRVLRFVAVVVYESQLENGLLADELACATSVVTNNINAEAGSGVSGAVEGGLEALMKLTSVVVNSSVQASAAKAKDNILLTVTPHINMLDFTSNEDPPTTSAAHPHRRAAAFGSTFQPATVHPHPQAASGLQPAGPSSLSPSLNGYVTAPPGIGATPPGIPPPSMHQRTPSAASAHADAFAERVSSMGEQSGCNATATITPATSMGRVPSTGDMILSGLAYTATAGTGAFASAGGTDKPPAGAGCASAPTSHGGGGGSGSGEQWLTPAEIEAAALAAETEALAAAAIAASEAKALGGSVPGGVEASAASGGVQEMARAPSMIPSSGGLGSGNYPALESLAGSNAPMLAEMFSDPLRRLSPPEAGLLEQDQANQGSASAFDATGPDASLLGVAPLAADQPGGVKTVISAFSNPGSAVSLALTGEGEASILEMKAAALAASLHAEEMALSRLKAMRGLQVYDYQRMFMSMSCRNPRKQLLCEPHSVKRIDYYSTTDLSLKQFIVAAAPHPNKRCGTAGCGEGVSSHVRTFLHGNARITMSIATLPPSAALPGEDQQQIWLWMRPKGMGPDSHKSIRRVPLSPDGAALSFGQFLQLSFTSDELNVNKRSLHHDFVRYFGLGRTVMCLYQDRIQPFRSEMPELVMAYSMPAQLKWLKQESLELCQEADEAFDVVETSLRQHPLFRAAAVKGTDTTPAEGSTSLKPNAESQSRASESGGPGGPTPGGEAEAMGSTWVDESTPPQGDSPHALSRQGSLTTAGAGAGAGTPPSGAGAGSTSGGVMPAGTNTSLSQLSLQAMMSAVRKDRASFIDKVGEAVRGPSASLSADTDQDNAGSQWNDEVMYGVIELNKLRRSLAITLLSWAATLQDPATFSSAYARASANSPSYLYTAVETGTNGTTALVDLVMDPADQSSSHLLPVPIVPYQSDGPIAVPVVAEMVACANAAQHSALGSVGSMYGELLEGSMGVLERVAPSRQTSCSAQLPIIIPEGYQGALDKGTLKADEKARASSSLGAAGAGGTSGNAAAAAARYNFEDEVGRRVAFKAAAQADAYTFESDDEEEGSFLAGWLSKNPSAYPNEVSDALPDFDEETFFPNALLGEDDSAFNTERGSTVSGGAGMLTSAPPSINDSVASVDKAITSDVHAHIPSPSALKRLEAGMCISPSVGRTLTARRPTPPASHASNQGGKLSYTQAPRQSDSPSNTAKSQEGDGTAASRPAGNSGMGVGGLSDKESVIPIVSERGTGGLSVALKGGPSPQPPSTPPREAAPPTMAGETTRGASGSAGSADLNARSAGPAAASTIATGAATSADSGPVVAGPASNDKADSGAGAADPASANNQGSGAAEAGAPLGTMKHLASFHVATTSAGGNETNEADVAAAAQPHSHRRTNTYVGAATSSSVVVEEPPVRPKETTSGMQLQTTQTFPSRAAQSVRTKLEGIAQHAAGFAAIARICLPGRAMLPSGINDMVIPIYDSEPTSIIAYFLSTRAYQQMLNATIKAVFQETRRSAHSKAAGNSWDGMGPSLSLLIPPTTPAESSPLEPAMSSIKTENSGGMIMGDAAPCGETLTDTDWLGLMLSKEPLHVRHQFEDDAPGMPWARAKFQVIAYYAPQFAELRRRCIAGGETSFSASMCRCRQWNSGGGKSNAYFAKSRDDRYIIKSLSKVEKASFLGFAPAYFEHMAKSCVSGQRTCLAKLLGVYSVACKPQGGGPGLAGSKDGVLDLLIMENCFYDRQITRIYDLKGSERNRFNAEAAANPQDAKEVHLDDNLRQANLTSPVFADPATFRSMELALWADSTFLANLDIMDYSLLVGVDKEGCCLAVAIIDFIRQFTWDKQLETWVKSSGMLGGNGKEPTIVSPKQYMRRFRMAIPGYFTVVPTSADMEPPLDPDLA